ncbi:MAG: MBL fold metallo-hydrolase, partial [Atopobiaceae bacterium]|nr:MBL fold metallo-hydrolase [Atopobiaceae bacterium]
MRSRLLSVLVGTMVLFALALTGCGQMEEVQVPVDKQGEAAAGLRVSFVDVGKGACILLQAGGAAALIDTGYEESADEVVDYLRAQGVGRLSWVVVTHYDRDHV